jgi:hypothetical protein
MKLVKRKRLAAVVCAPATHLRPGYRHVPTGAAKVRIPVPG